MHRKKMLCGLSCTSPVSLFRPSLSLFSWLSILFAHYSSGSGFLALNYFLFPSILQVLQSPASLFPSILLAFYSSQFSWLWIHFYSVDSLYSLGALFLSIPSYSPGSPAHGEDGAKRQACTDNLLDCQDVDNEPDLQSWQAQDWRVVVSYVLKGNNTIHRSKRSRHIHMSIVRKVFSRHGYSYC